MNHQERSNDRGGARHGVVLLALLPLLAIALVGGEGDPTPAQAGGSAIVPIQHAPLTAKLIDIANDKTDPFNQADTEPSIAVNPKDLKDIAVVAFSGNWDPSDPKVMA